MRTLEIPAQDARELAYGGDFSDKGWTVVRNEQVDSGRWESIHEIVFRDAKGDYWMSAYSQGLTESQDMRPWEDERVAVFWRVVPQERTIIEYVREPGA